MIRGHTQKHKELTIKFKEPECIRTVIRTLRDPDGKLHEIKVPVFESSGQAQERKLPEERESIWAT